MAVYKVPQDVEAEDKLIGPFSFRQFIYLIIVAIAGFVGYILAQLFIGLIIVPLPIILFFGALALPLRKDQPMETYLSAVIRFFLKPKRRLWQSDGTVNLVEVVAPHIKEEQRAKDISQDDARDRLSYLAGIMDTRGWSSRGVMSANDAVNDVVAAEAGEMDDILDDNAAIARSFDNRLEAQEHQMRQEAMERMQQQVIASAQAATAPRPVVAPSAQGEQIEEPAHVAFNPYPNSMHQRIIQPGGAGPATQPAFTPAPPDTPSADSSAPIPTQDEPETPVTTSVSPDILKLANNTDLSISAIAHEAQRLSKQDDTEVVISLR
jgi:hypothetical protein